ncbi:MAG: diaminopimelate epimerase, partial [Sedimentisphaerales bacterium]|nr:diaminopimelate epimerase [Sedimentisphaerales bacterium]
YEKKYVVEKHFRIQTLGGLVEAHIQDDTGNLIKVEMGKITFRSNEIPVRGNEREVVDEELDINGKKYRVTCLSIGNPHCVIPMADISEEKARKLGPVIEKHPIFSNRINMQLLKVLDRSNIEIQIWERGAGYTLASGSSSCAAAAAAYRLGLVDNEVNVNMPGGTLFIEIRENNEVYLTGEVEGVCEGYFHADLERKIFGKKS